MSAGTVTDSPTPADEWLTDNQRALMAEVATVGAALRGEPPDALPRAARSSALDAVCRTFSLSDFERSIVIACAANELDGQFTEQLAAAHGQPVPTFGLCLAALPDAHWSALLPDAPLRFWHLIQLGPGELTTAPLHIDEWLLHVLTGAFGLDQRLAPLLTRIDDLPTSTAGAQHAAEELSNAWLQPLTPAPVMLRGGARGSARTIVADACRRLDWQPYVLNAADLPGPAAEQDTLARLWQRMAMLHGAALLLECHDAGDAAIQASLDRFVDRLSTPTAVAADIGRLGSRPALTIDTATPSPQEQRELWQSVLTDDVNSAVVNDTLDRVVDQFDMDAKSIAVAAARAILDTQTDDRLPDLGSAIWQACRHTSRGGLDQLAQRLESTATFDDLVLPAEQRALLADILAHVRHRGLVYRDWRMSGPSSRGLGVSVLFAGPSGTGKTLAAEVLANALALDLYRIDLSQVVSKYIGETEKNLRRVFDAATTSGAVLLFDEADALFGKRSEVRDSHDRYANVEISYLLQAMESYRGLAVLTTNMRSALDSAFQRRLRFVVTFPFPGPAERAEIWRRAFPPATPTAELNHAKLAQLAVAGGNIRSIAVQAAFVAAEAGVPVGMREVLRAAAAEYTKLERPLTDTEIRGWT
ncbi:hypothetical protein BOO86_01395 [Mycobacterium sp. CBMA 234]|uniref:ATP-binding protein n=1 Tax=Mycolicibacterium sp. CBMA 234 TaxID=1918495 RepID=UPI0012DEB10F|nr:ATP-binding protein [Mycolicibacterium sp. CBMA 234]MUL63104.1 hypothetical protein [Mycolicibacterium sp. CBMA 234]